MLGLLEIIQSFGVEVDFTENTLKLRWKSDATDSNMDRDRMKKMRISILLLPALLARFGQAMFPFPGGCNIGKRPIGEHISGLVDLGYALSHDGEMMSLSGSKKTGEIHLYANRMVTATENLVMASVFRKGTTHIHSGAYEPHSIDVVNFFRSVGIEIETRYDHSIIIQGEENIPDHVEYTLIHDYLESGTFVIAGALAAEQYIDIEHACIADLDVFLERIRHAGVHTENLGNDTLRVYRATDLMATDIQTNIFPGLPSDLGSQIGVLLTQCEGNSRFHEVLYEGRFSYLGELEKMKAHVVVMNPHEAMIFGPTPLQ